jgi:Zn-dependent metalloprotease
MLRNCQCVCCIVPPHLLQKLMENPDPDIRGSAVQTLMLTEQMRGERTVRAAFAGATASPGHGRRTIFDCQNKSHLPSAVLARSEDGPASGDPSVNRAYEGFGHTREFFKTVFGRSSIDDRGMRLDGYVHRGIRYNNAFWDGQRMVFGDGDGVLFSDFTGSLDVIAHELGHGVTEYAAGLEYHNQSGALNESMSDVFGVLVKQWRQKEPASAADWLIGADIFTPARKGDALRSMKAPGTAYSNPDMGDDPQPDHMSKYVKLPDTADGDWGGVHINSGIPNRAFYLTATIIGGFAWEAAGRIWYEALRASSPTTDFQEFAETTYAKAGQLFGTGSVQQRAVQDAWEDVGLPLRASYAGGRGLEPETAAGLSSKLEVLSERLDALARRLDTTDLTPTA